MLAHRRTYGTPKITVYGAPRCSDCRQSKQFLSEQTVRYNWVDIGEDDEGCKRVQDLNDSKQIIPTIIFEAGSILVEPPNAELVAKWGISPKSKREYCDLVIVGSGFADSPRPLMPPDKGSTLVIEKGAIQARPAPLSASTTTPDSLKESAATN